MKTIYKILIPATLIFGLQKCNDLDHHIKQTLAVVRTGAPFLTHLSNSWSYEALAQGIDADALKGKEDEYREMLERVSDLGKWKNTCNKLNKTTVGHSWEIKKISLKSVCQFEHGEAEITFIAYDKPKFIGFNIIKLYRAAKT